MSKPELSNESIALLGVGLLLVQVMANPFSQNPFLFFALSVVFAALMIFILWPADHLVDVPSQEASRAQRNRRWIAIAVGLFSLTTGVLGTRELWRKHNPTNRVSVSIDCSRALYSPSEASRILMLVERLDSRWDMPQEKSSGFPGTISIDGRQESILCRVTNNSDERLLDLEMAFQGSHLRVTPAKEGGFVHESVSEQPLRDWVFRINTLEPGVASSFDFHVQNHSGRYSVSFTPPATAVFSMVGHEPRLRINLRRTGESRFLLEQAR